MNNFRLDFERLGYETKDGWDFGCGCCKVDFEVCIDNKWFHFEDNLLWDSEGNHHEPEEYLNG